MYFSVPSFSEVEGTLLAFRNHILVLRLVGINHVRLSGDVLSQILKEGLFFFCWSYLRMCDLYLCFLLVCFVLNVELNFHFILCFLKLFSIQTSLPRLLILFLTQCSHFLLLIFWCPTPSQERPQQVIVWLRLLLQAQGAQSPLVAHSIF